MDHVELVVELGDHALVRRARIDISEIFRTGLAEARQRGALPVVAQLPDVPFAVGVVAVQHIGAERNRLVEIELDGIGHLFEDMLGQDPDRAPTHREVGMEARIRLLELEHHGVGIGRLDRGDVAGEHRAEPHSRILDLGHHGRNHVIGGELDAVAPEDALAQLRGHFGEVGIVLRLVGRQRVVPDAVETAFRIDVPERIECGLLQPVGLRARIDRPDVEPAGVLDRPFRVLENQQFFSGNVLRNALRVRTRRQQQLRRHGAQSQHQQRNECGSWFSP